MLRLANRVSRKDSGNLGIAQLKKRLLATSGVSQGEILSKYPIGLNMHGYVIEQVQPIPEFSLVAVKLKHSRTGSEHLHLDTPNDKNNVFLVAFKTNAPDATGVPHILEHTTLCGSFKYPVRDPFFKMLNRSLSNFMNAMTGHDYTYYPFATTNAKDFENLMDVYLSSVFEPLLTHESFMQEGWRLENSDLSDPKSPIIFKGVVYNEMKGQYSNSAYYYWIKFQEAIYGSLNNSGGNPNEITDLRYEDLVDFHSSNYHPSNAKTFTYGNIELVNHLNKLNEFFESFGSRGIRTNVRKPITELNPNYESDITVKGPLDTMSSRPIEEQYKSSITWVIGNPLDESKLYDVFKWKVLSSLLCDGHNSPFYQELIEKEYGEDFAVNYGLDATTALLSFTIGLNNLSLEKAKNLEDKVRGIFVEKIIPELQKGKESGFNDRIEAILHQIELNFKNHKPEFGIGLLSSVVSTWVNGLNPVKSLQIDHILNRFKEDYKLNGLRMFQDLLDESVLKDDTPKFKFTMEPDESFGKNLTSQETERLNKKIEALTEEDKEIIYKRSIELAEKQKKEEDVSALPTLTVKDIPREGDFYPLDFADINSKKLQKRIVDTNGLIYMNATKDISYLPSKYYEYLPLFDCCLTNLAGTSKTPITELEIKIQKLTGGVTFNVSAKTDPFDISKTNMKFMLSGMALKDKSQNVYDLWFEILTQTKFDSEDEQVVDKLFTLVKNLGQNQMNTIADSGHSYANSYSNSQLTPTKYIHNLIGGIGQVSFILDLNRKLETEGRDFLKKELLPVLKDIQRHLVNGFTDGNHSGFEYSLVGDSESVIKNEKMIKEFDDLLTANSNRVAGTNELSSLISQFNSNKLGLNNNGRSTLIDLPFQVGYASLAKLGAAYTSKDGAALRVLSQLLTFKHLHSVIREANGAYGGGLLFDGLGGCLNFYSYRDPNPLTSVQSFKDSTSVALGKMINSENNGWSPKDLQEAKLTIFQGVDAPSHISLQGSLDFLEHITDEMRQERRERFLDVTYEDLKNVTEKYLLNGSQDIVTVIGDNETLKIDSSDAQWNIKKLTA